MRIYKKMTDRFTINAYISLGYNWCITFFPYIRLCGSKSNRKSFGLDIGWLVFDCYFWFTWMELFHTNKENVDL
jgi:hypothetical protein